MWLGPPTPGPPTSATVSHPSGHWGGGVWGCSPPWDPSSQGAFGCCYQLVEVASGRVYAAKVIPRAQLAAVGVAERVERERELHGRLRHRHIVRLHGHFAAGTHLYLLLEYCGRRSLAHILRARGRLTEPEVRYYLRQIISGLRYLHGQGIVHRDLKPSNFLVTEKMQVKIGDLGLAQREAPAGRRWGALCGTPSYLAPEVLDRKGHGVPSDVWALGCSVVSRRPGCRPAPAARCPSSWDGSRWAERCGGPLRRWRGGGRAPCPPARAASSAGPEPRKQPLRKTFISAGNRLKSSH
ncbi:inactive serine/threonine-protein kinase PLK5 isoform X4 [Strix aluco]|uniref:inactive serine/threonine-protein kinase PLK5 isoform X4 n=1 Tax=Strix aluco TaxID=111821 RepID=UPI003DA46F06